MQITTISKISVDVKNHPLAGLYYLGWWLSGYDSIRGGLRHFITRKKASGEKIKKIIPQLSPYEEAIKSMQELKQQNLPANGQVKLYYTTLNDILRQFVMRKLQIASMVKTNEELIILMRELKMSPYEFSQLAQSLRMSDFVKFAKYLPDQSANEQNFSIILSSVELLNKIER